MATVFLVRHGRTKANADGILAGWSPGVVLDDVGLGQAEKAATRLAAVPLHAVISSPLDRTIQTADAIVAAQAGLGRQPDCRVEDRFGECGYGEWTGRPLRDLANEPLWRVVQEHPSAAVFPGGESMMQMQHRAVTAVREFNAEFGADVTYAVVSHGDVIKAILADALGMHLDAFQRIVVDPCSVSVVRYAERRPFVLRTNDTSGDLGGFAAPARTAGGGSRVTRKARALSTRVRSAKRGSRGSSDAVVGGGAG